MLRRAGPVGGDEAVADGGADLRALGPRDPRDRDVGQDRRLGPQREGLLEQLGVELETRTNVARDDRFATSVEGVFVAGDMGRGQSLIVWAIAEGRSCAAEVDRYLMGDTALPRIINPTDRPLT